MSSDELADFWVHTVTVHTLDGHGALGPTYADPVDLACFVDDTIRLVRDPQAHEVVSSTTIYAPAGTTVLTVGSLVTLPTRTATVLTVAVRDSGDLDLPDHVEAALT